MTHARDRIPGHRRGFPPRELAAAAQVARLGPFLLVEPGSRAYLSAAAEGLVTACYFHCRRMAQENLAREVNAQAAVLQAPALDTARKHGALAAARPTQLVATATAGVCQHCVAVATVATTNGSQLSLQTIRVAGFPTHRTTHYPRGCPFGQVRTPHSSPREATAGFLENQPLLTRTSLSTTGQAQGLQVQHERGDFLPWCYATNLLTCSKTRPGMVRITLSTRGQALRAFVPDDDPAPLDETHPPST